MRPDHRGTPEEESLPFTPPPAAPATPPGPPPLQFVVNDPDAPDEVINAMLVSRFATGELPFARSRRLGQVKQEHPLLPSGATVVRTSTGSDGDTVLAEGAGWAVRSRRWRYGAQVQVLAETAETAERVLKESVDGAEREETLPPSEVSMGFWHHSPRGGPVRTVRRISATAWEEARANYSASVTAAMERLMTLTPQQVSGRLLLLHGPPGTGKTSVLRTLARSWREWCQVDCVLDPERMFNDMGYLMDVALGEDDDEDEDERDEERTGAAGADGDAAGADGNGAAGVRRPRWRLLLLEDCDELIRGGAKDAAGQALSRLLNLTDGLLGQGRRVLVGITTNEDLERLHPAVVRPGRCLARVEIGPLSAGEARAWLGTDRLPEGRRIGPEGVTLAELFAARRGAGPAVVTGPEPGGGMYL